MLSSGGLGDLGFFSAILDDYAIQGDWLSFDSVLKADLSWSSLIYSIPQELLKFLMNCTQNVLPTPDNLKR